MRLAGVGSLLGLLAVLAPGNRHAAAQETRSDTAHADASMIVPLPVLFYQPETGTGFGVLVGYFFRPGTPAPGTVPASEVTGAAIYTTRKQILAGAVGT